MESEDLASLHFSSTGTIVLLILVQDMEVSRTWLSFGSRPSLLSLIQEVNGMRWGVFSHTSSPLYPNHSSTDLKKHPLCPSLCRPTQFFWMTQWVNFVSLLTIVWLYPLTQSQTLNQTAWLTQHSFMSCITWRIWIKNFKLQRTYGLLWLKNLSMFSLLSMTLGSLSTILLVVKVPQKTPCLYFHPQKKELTSMSQNRLIWIQSSTPPKRRAWPPWWGLFPSWLKPKLFIMIPWWLLQERL